MSLLLPFVWVLVAGASLIGSRPPAALEVDHAGIRWARGRKRVDMAWDAIVGFDVARPADRQVEFRNGLSLFVKQGEPASRSTQEVSVGPTHFLSDTKLDHFLAAVRYYRNDLALTSQEIRPAVSSKFVPKLGRKTPVLNNGVKPKSQVGRLAFAIALGFAIPIGLGVLVLVT